MEADFKKYIAKTIREAVKEEVSQAINTAVVPIFVEMVRESEKRIDKTNAMIMTMSDTMSKHLILFDKIVAQLQSSKVANQENVKTLLASNTELLKQLESQLAQSKSHRDDYEKRIKEEVAHNRQLVAKITSLAEKVAEIKTEPSGKGVSARSNVRVDVTK